jgi:DNA-binding NarL/FixJ family response regulator
MPQILIADDSEAARRHLRVILGRRLGWTVCGETGNGLKAVLLASELKPDLVILELVLPMLDGLQASTEIAKIFPSVPIVIYSKHVLPKMEVDAKEFGVWAMVPKSEDEKPLIETLERLFQGVANAKVEVASNPSAKPEVSADPQTEPAQTLLPEPD